MADYIRTQQRPRSRIVYRLDLPTTWVEVEKMLEAIRAEAHQLTKGAHSWSDDAVTVESDGDEITAWFEITDDMGYTERDIIDKAASWAPSIAELTSLINDASSFVPTSDRSLTVAETLLERFNIRLSRRPAKTATGRPEGEGLRS